MNQPAAQRDGVRNLQARIVAEVPGVFAVPHAAELERMLVRAGLLQMLPHPSTQPRSA